MYDSSGNFVSYGETDGGYGHLSFDQIALRGPASQRPVVAKGEPWEIDIYPRDGMAPSAPQTVHLSISFMHRVGATSIALSRKSVTLKPGASARVKATVTAPQARAPGSTASPSATATRPRPSRSPCACRSR